MLAGGVFIHCMAGVSRSATVVIGWLMQAHKVDFEEGLRCVTCTTKLSTGCTSHIIYIYIYHSTNDVRHINHTISDVSSACNLMWSTAERRYDRASVQ
jgi:hypothetical protein